MNYDEDWQQWEESWDSFRGPTWAEIAWVMGGLIVWAAFFTWWAA